MYVCMFNLCMYVCMYVSYLLRGGRESLISFNCRVIIACLLSLLLKFKNNAHFSLHAYIHTHYIYIHTYIHTYTSYIQTYIDFLTISPVCCGHSYINIHTLHVFIFTHIDYIHTYLYNTYIHTYTSYIHTYTIYKLTS